MKRMVEGKEPKQPQTKTIVFILGEKVVFLSQTLQVKIRFLAINQTEQSQGCSETKHTTKNEKVENLSLVNGLHPGDFASVDKAVDDNSNGD